MHDQNTDMKKYMITALFGLGVIFAFSQNGYNPPDNVRRSFQKEYPQSQPTRWYQSNASWNVDFEDRDHNNGEVTAHFNSNGRHIDTHVPYDNHDVPAPVVENLNRNYPGANNYEYTRIDRPGESGVYQVNLNHRGKRKTVYMDNRGYKRDYRDNHQ